MEENGEEKGKGRNGSNVQALTRERRERSRIVRMCIRAIVD